MKHGLVLIALLAAACNRQHVRNSSAAAPPVPPAPSIQQLMDVKLGDLTIAPQTVHIDQSATVTAEVSGAPAGAELTLAWFAPDGWLVADQMQPVSGKTMTFVVPSHTFKKAGQYRGNIRTDVVPLGDITVSVVD